MWAIQWAYRLQKHVLKDLKFSPAFEAAFLRLRIKSPVNSFHITSFPLWQLGCLLDEVWLEEDVLNAMVELLYFWSCATSEDASFVYLPTLFFNDARCLFNGDPKSYSKNISNLRLCLSIAKATRIASVMWDRDHYSATFYQHHGSFEHGDSMLRSAPEGTLDIFHWLMAGLDYMLPQSLETGEIGLQLLGGSGSCGVIAHNYVESRMDHSVPQWEATASAHFRIGALRDLIIYHLSGLNSPVCNNLHHQVFICWHILIYIAIPWMCQILDTP